MTTFFFIIALVMLLWNLRLTKVNDSLRRRVDPWANLERHYRQHPRVLP